MLICPRIPSDSYGHLSNITTEGKETQVPDTDTDVDNEVQPMEPTDAPIEEVTEAPTDAEVLTPHKDSGSDDLSA